MRRLLLIPILLSFHTAVYTQINYTLRIVNTQGQSITNTEVTALNNEQNIRLKAITDPTGTVTFELRETGTYKISSSLMKDIDSVEVLKGMIGKTKRTVTYDPEQIFADIPLMDRSRIQFKNGNPLEFRGRPGVIKLVIEVKKRNESVVPNLKTDIIDCQDLVRYPSTTNAAGNATFYLIAGRNYEVDVDGVEGIEKINLEKSSYTERKKVVYYEKTNVSEIAKGDTIFQNQAQQTQGTTSRLLFTLTLVNFDGAPLPDEVVYLSALNSKKVYAGKTDASGACKVMLEKGPDYVVNLKYEQGIHLVKTAGMKGFATAATSSRYRGSLAIDKMLSERKVNDKGFVTSFKETPVFTAKKPSGYLTKTPTGYTVDFSSSGPIGTPTVSGDLLFTQAGFYSPGFYCLKASTGEYIWGVELGETGMSPAVLQNDVLLINTYSCSLYALNINTGKLLWSKWLAGTIYSTPSADNTSVYVVYNGGENVISRKENYVIASFDLHSGKMNWANSIDKEVIACPVLDGNEVHIASQSGNYYVFDKKDGKLVQHSLTVNAVSSPTITNSTIYVTSNSTGIEKLVVLDRKTLKPIKKYQTTINSGELNSQHDAMQQMNFNGSHPVVYKNKWVVLLDSSGISVMDVATEKMIWRKLVKTANNQVPIVANDQVIVATLTNEIVSFDMNTGNSKIEYSQETSPGGQPVFNQDRLFISDLNELNMVKSPLSFQWNQWNKDAGHNLVMD